MNDKLPTREELLRTLAICEKATEGPWENDSEYWILRKIDIGKRAGDGSSKYQGGVEPVVGIWESDLELRLKYADAKFILEARTALPAYSRELLRLRELMREYPPGHKAECRSLEPSGYDAEKHVDLYSFPCDCGLTARLAELGLEKLR